MCKKFKIKTDIAQNLINDFFFYFWLSEDLSIGKMLREKEYGGYGVNFWKDEALYAELNERAEAAIISYSATGDFLQYL